MLSRRAASLALAVLMVTPAAVLSTQILAHGLTPTQVVRPDALPTQVGEWQGTDVPLTEADEAMLETPGWSQKVYRDSVGDQIQVMLLQVNNTQNAHDPKLCMVGSGYTLMSERAIPIPGAGGDAMEAWFADGDQRTAMLSWLQTEHGTVENLSGGLKFAGILAALHGQRLAGVAVRVIELPNAVTGASPTDDGRSIAFWKALAEQIDFNGLVARVGREAKWSL